MEIISLILLIIVGIICWFASKGLAGYSLFSIRKTVIKEAVPFEVWFEKVNPSHPRIKGEEKNHKERVKWVKEIKNLKS